MSEDKKKTQTNRTAPSEIVRFLMGKNRKRWRVLVALELIGLLIAVPMAYLLLAFLLDNLLYFGAFGRWMAHLGFLASVGGILYISIRRWRKSQPTTDEIALAIEKQIPGGIQNRIINAVQFSEGRGAGKVDPAWLETVIEENSQYLSKLQLPSALSARGAAITLGVATGVLLLAGGLVAFNKDPILNAAKRVFMPFAAVDPLYRTRLHIEPGNTRTTTGEVNLRIRIEGEVPSRLELVRQSASGRRQEVIPVPSGQTTVSYPLRELKEPTSYVVMGGDFRSPRYTIEVPMPAQIRQVRATYRYPEYTGLAPRTVETQHGEIDAIRNTQVSLEILFDRPVAESRMIVVRGRRSGDASEGRHEMRNYTRVDDQQYQGMVVVDQATAYQIESKADARDTDWHSSRMIPIRVTPDAPPFLEISGIPQPAQVETFDVLPLSLEARDDFGLDFVSLYYRPVDSDGDLQRWGRHRAEPWKPEELVDWNLVERWDTSNEREFSLNLNLDGERFEDYSGKMVALLLVGADRDPAKEGSWFGSRLQILEIGDDQDPQFRLYEQIRRIEASLTAVRDAQQRNIGQARRWMAQFEGGRANRRWDRESDLADLNEAMRGQARAQNRLREQLVEVVRDIPEVQASVRVTLGLLADTEVVRAGRMLEAVERRDTGDQKRGTLNDAIATQDRVRLALDEQVERWIQYREAWEENYLPGLINVLARRQQDLSEQSEQFAGRENGDGVDRAQLAGVRRQERIEGGRELVSDRLGDVALRVEERSTTLSSAMLAASGALAAEELTQMIRDSHEAVEKGEWSKAAENQALAAAYLESIYSELRIAQNRAARERQLMVGEKTDSDTDEQGDIAEQRAGSDLQRAFLPDDADEAGNVDIRMREIEAADAEDGQVPEVEDYSFEDWMLDAAIRGEDQREPDQDFTIQTLGDTAGMSRDFPDTTNLPIESQVFPPAVQGEFFDLMGDLLPRVEDVSGDFQDLTNWTDWVMELEPGTVGEQSGDLSASSMIAFTGNTPPPPTNVGGASQSGREGGRSDGMVGGDTFDPAPNPDPFIDGKDRAADQEGLMTGTDPDYEPGTPSAGVGGKEKETPEDPTFNVADVGELDHDDLDSIFRDEPGETAARVDRAGKPFPPELAQKLVDHESNVEQIVERIKSVKKELDNLFLPSDHLDEISQRLLIQVSQLRDAPTAALVREHQETLDQLAAVMSLFGQAQSGLQPSLPRTQIVRGPVRDMPARPALPGYEAASEDYFNLLTVGQ